MYSSCSKVPGQRNRELLRGLVPGFLTWRYITTPIYDDVIRLDKINVVGTPAPCLECVNSPSRSKTAVITEHTKQCRSTSGFSPPTGPSRALRSWVIQLIDSSLHSKKLTSATVEDRCLVYIMLY
jgi:hypothetical protein